MSRWKQVARELREAQGGGTDGADQLASTPIGANGTNGAGRVSLPLHAFTPSDPAGWMAAIARLDASRPPVGIDPEHWQRLLIDARWLCHQHGVAAYRLGWTASDLFGLGPAPGWGGLADRLAGDTRHIVLTGRIAHWRGQDMEGWLWRETLLPMPLLWQHTQEVIP